MVQEPTRGPNLLDLALSSLAGAAAASVTPGIADYKGLLIAMNLSIPKFHVTQRTVWGYKRVDWKGLKNALRTLDYDISSFANIDDATETFCSQGVI